MYKENNLLFPNSAIPILENSRGKDWNELVKRACEAPEDHPARLAFVLTMMRFSGCIDCETDSYRAMRGCENCALQTLRRFKGDDDELIEAYVKALQDIERYFEKAQIA